MIKELLYKKKFKKKTVSGFGPFPKKWTQSFISSICDSCGVHLPESTLLGNALVIEEASIRIKCAKCRIGRVHELYRDHPKNTHKKSKANNTIDRELIVCEIYDYMTNFNKDLTWFEIVLCLRGDIDNFQKFNRRKFQGLDKTISDSVAKRYGNPLPGSCSECGALWANEWEMNQKNINEILEQRRYSEEKCWACGFETKHQWFMRETIDTEIKKIENAV